MFPRAVIEEVDLATPGECRLFLAKRKRDKASTRTLVTESSNTIYTHCAFSKFEHTGEKNVEGKSGDQTAILSGGTRVRFIGLEDGKVKSQLTDFTNVVQCCRFRDDGKLLIASDDDGRVRVIEPAKRNILRLYKFHEGRVRRCDFTRERTSAISAGDDLRACLWDLSESSPVRVWSEAHQDNISVCETPGASSSFGGAEFVTASRDGWLKLWDARVSSSSAVRGIYHGCAVEAAHFFTSGSRIAVAADTAVYIWDLAQSGVTDFTQQEEAHNDWLQKRVHHLGTVSDVRVGLDDRTILTASSDRTIKLTTLSDTDVQNDSFEVTRSFLMSAPVACCAASSDNKFFLGATERGTFELSQVVGQAEKEEPSMKMPRPGTLAYFKRGRQAPLKAGDEQLSLRKTKEPRILPPTIERMTKAFQYQKAVMEAVRLDSVDAFAALCEELAARGSLGTAMRGKDEAEASALLRFMKKHLMKPTTSLQHSVLIAFKIFLGTWIEAVTGCINA